MISLKKITAAEQAAFFMEKHIQFGFAIPEGERREILIAQLEAEGFYGFEEQSKQLFGFIRMEEKQLNEIKNKIEEYFIIDSVLIVEDKNWNQIWESGFEPVIIHNKAGKPVVYIRANFHPQVPGIPQELVITPRMSFGTGHHATTSLMVQAMLSENFEGKSVVDFGTGTGILAILAEKYGAAEVLAIDNDEWSISNAVDNIAANHCNDGVISMQLANHFPKHKKFEVILANINLNVILGNLPEMLSAVSENGVILISGLLEADENILKENLPSGFLQNLSVDKQNGWILVKLRRGGVSGI